jgi:hypothetical protein
VTARKCAPAPVTAQHLAPDVPWDVVRLGPDAADLAVGVVEHQLDLPVADEAAHHICMDHRPVFDVAAEVLAE